MVVFKSEFDLYIFIFLIWNYIWYVSGFFDINMIVCYYFLVLCGLIYVNIFIGFISEINIIRYMFVDCYILVFINLDVF